MNVIKNIALILLVAFLVGCASYRTVSVQLIDDKTKAPIAGVTVATVYTPKPFSLASRKQAVSKSGKEGVVFLHANYLKREPTLFGRSEFSFAPSFCVDSPGYRNSEIWPSPNDTEGILLRKPSESPSKPDITIELAPETGSTGRPPDLCKQPSALRQLGYDFSAAWKWMTSPFRPARRID
jgi:hypothetical protein